MKTLEKAFPYLKRTTSTVEFGVEPGNLQRGRSLAFEQTLKAATNIYISVLTELTMENTL